MAKEKRIFYRVLFTDGRVKYFHLINEANACLKDHPGATMERTLHGRCRGEVVAAINEALALQEERHGQSQDHPGGLAREPAEDTTEADERGDPLGAHTKRAAGYTRDSQGNLRPLQVRSRSSGYCPAYQRF